MVPIHLLTGFLGSGKTTVLARLLRDPALARTAVIINEIGEVGIDHDLVASSDESFVELTTGCLCCKVRSDLVATLEELLGAREAGRVMCFERIIIETSGLADPAPILHALMTAQELVDRTTMAEVITTVDAATGLHTLAHEQISAKQVAIADRLLVTKTDLTSGIPHDLVERLDNLNTTAPRVVVIMGAIDADTLLAPADPEAAARRLARAAEIAADAMAHDRDDTHHLDGITSYVIMRETPLPAIALTLFLEALAEHAGTDLLRLKGLVAIAEYPSQPAVVHGVHHIFHPLGWLDQWPSDDRSTRLVFITRGLPKSFVSALLDAIVAEVVEASRQAGSVA